MEITGVGIDIENITRFKRKVFVRNKFFYNNIFSPREIAYCLRKADSAESFAGKFCAKEAVLKALQKNNLFSMKQIEIINNAAGQPRVFQKGKKLKCLISIAHCDSWATAFCVAYK